MSNRVVLGGVLGLVIGFGLAWLLKPAEIAPADPVVDIGDAAPETAESEAAMQADGAAPGPRLVPLERPSGSGRITGRVTDAEGEGIPGVRIQADLNDADLVKALYGTPGKPVSLEEEVQRATDAVLRRRAAQTSAVTGADGRYVLADLAAGDYRLAAVREGYEFRTAKGSESWRAKVGSAVDFTGREAVRIMVEVIMSNGARADRATVVYAGDKDDRRGRRAGWSASSPSVAFDVGTWWVRAEVRDDRGARSAPVQVRCAPGEAPPALTLRMGTAPGLRGRLVFPEGVKSKRVDVMGRRYEGAEPPKYTMGGRRGWVRARAKDGTYYFEDVEPGQWAVVAVMERQVQVLETVQVGEGLAEVDLKLPAVDTSKHLKAVITGPDGKPLDRLRFSISFQTANASVGGGVNALEGADGVWWLDMEGAVLIYSKAEPGRRFPKGTYALTTRHPTYGELVTSFDPNETDELELAFNEKVDVRIELQGMKSQGVADMVTLWFTGPPKPTGYQLSGRSYAAIGERFEIKGVQPGDVWGRFMLNTEDAEGRPRSVTIGCWPLTLDSGTPSIKLVLPRLHQLDVSATQVEGRPSSVTLSRVDPGNKWAHSAAYLKDGRTTLDYIPPGRYEVTATRRDGTTMRAVVTIPADKRVTLE